MTVGMARDLRATTPGLFSHASATLRRTLAEFVEHYHRERNHRASEMSSSIVRLRRGGWVGFAVASVSGGLLNYYYRAA